jgi:hypothetical protein
VTVPKPGMMAWCSPIPWWKKSGQLLVSEHPILILDVSGNEMTMAVCASDPPIHGDVAIPLTIEEYPSLFKPHGILDHKTHLFIKSNSGECLPVVPAIMPHCKHNTFELKFRKPCLMELGEFKKLANIINPLIRKHYL